MADCPTPEKVDHPTEVAARRALALRRRETGRPDLEPYLCRCGAWHLTSGTSLNHRIRSALGR